MNKIEQWHKYLKEFNREVEQTIEEKKQAATLFVGMLDKLLIDGKDNDYREVSIEGYNDYNGYGIVIDYDYHKDRRAFEISYSDKHIAAFEAYPCYICKEYVNITNKHSPTNYKKAIKLIKKIILGKAGLLWV